MGASVALPSEYLTDLEKRIAEAPHHKRFYTKLNDLCLREDHRSRFWVLRKKINVLFTLEEKLKSLILSSDEGAVFSAPDF